MIRELAQIDSNNWESKLHRDIYDFCMKYKVEPTISVNREFLAKAGIPANSVRGYCLVNNPSDTYLAVKYEGYTIKIDNSIDPDFAILSAQPIYGYVNEDLPWY